MEFSGQYLTYEEYRALGGDTTLLQAPFDLLEFEARRRIDIRTFDRLKNVEEIPQEVKLCEFNMINSMSNYAKSVNSVVENNNIKSENTDGYSVSYTTVNDIGEIVKSKSTELDDIIRTYLLGVIVNGEHIMYVGVK